MKPLISPDIAPVQIRFDDEFVVVELKNLGDRDYEPKDSKIKDSFMRKATFKRVVHIGATSYTEDFKSRIMGPARAGQSFNAAYPLPKPVAGATKYTWIVTIEGEDPNPNNNTFTKVQKITKIN